jgi:F0F1-type ATP synthase delta subunit
MHRRAKIVVVLLVIAASGFFIFSKISGWHKNELDTAIKQQQETSLIKTDKLEQKITELERELTVVRGQIVPEEKLAEVFGQNADSAEITADREKLAEVMGEVKKLARIVRDEKELATVLGDEKKITAILGDETKLIEVLREEGKLARVLRDEKKLTLILQNEKKLAEIFGGDDKSAEVPAEREKLAEVMGEINKLARIVRDEKELATVLGDEKKMAAILGDETKLIEVLREEGKLARVLRDEKKLTLILQNENKLAEILALPQEEKDEVGQVTIVKKKIRVSKGQPDFTDIERQIMAFFSYLDQQPYVQSYEFAGGSYLQYQIAIKNLSAKPPIVSGEMQSIYNMVRNVAHFYRVMGKNRVFVTRQVLQNESEIIESVIKTFFQWFTMDSGNQSTRAGRPSPEIMYEYAGYILNTLGGRSYLLRRSPKVRALTTYYCVLALDQANAEELNSKGIDIRPYIKSSLLEVKNQIGLIYQKEYITKLSELNLKYYLY